jgi:GT2 family glycosyltransferase/GR25 family glycosyltransferase involved in LPS biosynthesis
MTILMYHKIDLESPTMWWVSVDRFYQQMLDLKSKQVVYLDDYNPQDANQVAITFDGVYKNILQYAAPILQAFNYPFELFITSNYIGIDNTFDSVEPLAQFADLQELKSLVKMNGRLQWHTKSHVDLTENSQAVDILAELDIPENIRELDPLGFKWFAYPYGRFDRDILLAVQDRFSGAVSCHQGNDSDIYCLNRLTVTNHSNFSQAKIAVIIASYNYGSFLVEAIESVLRQTRLPDEILISDDASTDNTYEIATFYQHKYPDLIKINRNEQNLGIVDHFNKAIRLTTADYITILGADNRFRSDYLEKTAEILDLSQDLAIAYTDFALFGQRAKLVYETFPKDKQGIIKLDKFFIINFPDFTEESRQQLIETGNFIHGSSLFRRAAFDRVGGYLQFPNLPEDYALFRRMIEAGWQAKRAPFPLLEYRQHSRYQTNIQLGSFGELQFYKNLVKENQIQLEQSRTKFQQIQSEIEQSRIEIEQSRIEIEQSRIEIEQSRIEIEQSRIEIEQSQSQLDFTRDEMAKLQNSMSVKITLPLRMIAMLIRGQFADFTIVGLSIFPRQITGKLTRINRLFNVLTNSPELLDNFSDKSTKAIKRIITGRSDLVIAGIRQHLHDKNVEETISIESTISVEDIIILTTKHTRYIGHLLQKSLAEVGYQTSLSEKFSKDRDVGQLHFVICPQMFSQLPKNFVAFQLEQSVSSRWFTPKYFENLQQAYNIFEYSVSNIKFLLKNDVSYNKIFYLPIGSFAGYRAYLQNINYQIEQIDTPIEVLFYGDSNCPRRQMYLEKLNSEFNVYIAAEVFGAELVSLICRAKVVVNIHYYEGALLETTRIHETLSLGTPIVSESSIDIDSHIDLEGVVSFTPIGDIDAMMLELHSLLTEEMQQQRRIEIAEFVERDRKFSDYFKRFLLSNDLFNYSFNDYEKDVDCLKISEDVPRLCLSLTETPARQDGFSSKSTYGFKIVEGLRYYQGWIGCGMSYKYMLNKVDRSGCKYAIICEDDVIFTDDFDSKIDATIAYLQQTNRQWHIFVALIADLHPDTQILAIEEHEGIEYIYLNRMTSMVMNIYSSEIMKIISQWDPSNKDVETNTIDRYIESQIELIVVTTLPYLVGHAEDQNSTLWGFANTQYSEMIQLSQSMLAEKVQHYKLK